LTLRTLHLAVNFEDGFYIGELVVIMDVETVKNSLLFWYWPSKQELMNTNRAVAFKVCSTERFVVFKLENLDFVETFTEM
jgi:hypothetical protein